jgi:molybdenum cofactor cytidylyltransferase
MYESGTRAAPAPLGDAAGIVLAAGAARRFGATKQLAVLDGAPLVGHAITALRAAGIDRVVVVTGHDAAAVERVVGAGATCVRNPDHARGQSTSVRAGLDAAEHLLPPVEVVVVLLADQPRLPAAVIREVLDASQRSGRPARARYVDAAGPPVALPRACWAEVRHRLHGDAGAGSFLAGLGVEEVPVQQPMPRDVDHVSDLRSLSEHR